MANHSYLRTHNLAAEHPQIDLHAARAELEQLAGPTQDRRGETPVRQGGLSVVLAHLRRGLAVQEHSAPGAVTLQVLRGRVRVKLGEGTLDAGAETLVAFDARVRHAVEAVDDSALLLTLADGKPRKEETS